MTILEIYEKYKIMPQLRTHMLRVAAVGKIVCDAVNEKVKQNIISDKQLAINAKIAQFQKNINAIGVTPFNSDSWSA